MDSKPKRQLTDQQRANLAAGREKLKTLRADPEYAKNQKEKREERKRESAAAAAASAASTSSVERKVKAEPSRSGYSASVPSL